MEAIPDIAFEEKKLDEEDPVFDMVVLGTDVLLLLTGFTDGALSDLLTTA